MSALKTTIIRGALRTLAVGITVSSYAVSTASASVAPDRVALATIQAYVDAYNRQDADAALALTTPNFVRRSSTTSRTMSRQQWYEMWRNFDAAFPDERWEQRAIYVSRGRVVLRVVERGTFLAPWVLPGGTVVPPTGRSYRADSILVFRVTGDGLISSYDQYTTLGFLQVGLTPQAIAGIVRGGL